MERRRAEGNSSSMSLPYAVTSFSLSHVRPQMVVQTAEDFRNINCLRCIFARGKWAGMRRALRWSVVWSRARLTTWRRRYAAISDRRDVFGSLVARGWRTSPRTLRNGLTSKARRDKHVACRGGYDADTALHLWQ